MAHANETDNARKLAVLVAHVEAFTSAKEPLNQEILDSAAVLARTIIGDDAYNAAVSNELRTAGVVEPVTTTTTVTTVTTVDGVTQEDESDKPSFVESVKELVQPKKDEEEEKTVKEKDKDK